MENKDKFWVWNKQDKNWNTYQSWSIEINGEKYFISIFKNTKKEQWSKQPDFNLMLNKAGNQFQTTWTTKVNSNDNLDDLSQIPF